MDDSNIPVRSGDVDPQHTRRPYELHSEQLDKLHPRRPSV